MILFLGVMIGGMLGGFTFQSARAPSGLSTSDFAIDLVGGVTGTEYPTTVLLNVPEPSTLVLFGIAAIAFIGRAATTKPPA